MKPPAPQRAAREAASWLLLAACSCVPLEPSLDSTRYYVLAATSDARAAPEDDGPIVCLHRPALPDYLSRREIAVRNGEHRIVYSELDVWAEPLEEGVPRVLARELAAQPGIARVVPWSFPDDERHHDVSVWLLSFESVERDGRWELEVAARWESREPTGALSAQGTFEAPPSAFAAGDHERLAAELSESLGGLARDIGQWLPKAASASHR